MIRGIEELKKRRYPKVFWIERKFVDTYSVNKDIFRHQLCLLADVVDHSERVHAKDPIGGWIKGSTLINTATEQTARGIDECTG